MGFFQSLVDDWDEIRHEQDNPKLAKGTVIRVEKTTKLVFGYYHYGIYAGRRKVIHFSRGKIRRDSIENFTSDTGAIFDTSTIDVIGFDPEHIKGIPLKECYERAKSCVGKTGYDVLENNCEHFALWCRTGKAISAQAFGSESDAYSNLTSALFSTSGIADLYDELGMEVSREVFHENL